MSASGGAFVTRFRELDRWITPKRGALLADLHPDWSIAKVGEVVRQVTERIKVETDTEYRLIGVRWYGEGTFHRETVMGDALSATYLTPVIPSTFIYNRLFAWKASFAVVPPEHEGHFVSNEFPQFIVDSRRILPEYLYLFFMLDSTVAAVNAASVGSAAVSRNRFKEEEFVAFEILLPPLETQHAVVARWQAAQAEADAVEERLRRVEAELPRLILGRLGIPVRQNETPPKMLVCGWRDLERWSVGFVSRALTGVHDVGHSGYPVHTLGDLALVSYGIQKSPENRPGSNARPYLRVANVQKGQLDLAEIKYIEVSNAEMEALRLKQGDLLVCEGNSADLVGRPAMWNDEIPDCVHQNHILKVRINQEVAFPEYVLEYMQTPPARSYFRSRAKFTTHLASINSNDLRELPIPLPPLDTQRDILQDVQAGRAEIARLRDEAARVRRDARAQVAALILGTGAV